MQLSMSSSICRESSHNSPFSSHSSQRKIHIATKIEKKPGRIEHTLRAEELAGDVEGFTSHDDDLLTVEQLLSNSAGQATQEVSLAVNDDLRKTQELKSATNCTFVYMCEFPNSRAL